MKFSKWFIGGLAGALVLAFVAGAALAAKPVGIRQASDGSEYSAGWLCVKFKASLREQLSGTLLPNAVQLRSGVLMRNGVLLEPRLGVPSVDALNAKYGVTGIERMVPSPNPVSALKEYGVDLIFTMHLDPSLDLERVAREYEALPEVEDAYPSTVYRADAEPDDPYRGTQWHLPMIQAWQAYDISHGDSTQSSVWVVDPDIGLDWHHEDIQDGLWINGPEDYNHNGKFEDYSSSSGGDEDDVDNDGNGFIDDVIGWDWMQWDNDPSPNAGGDDHGTHTWGCCMAQTNNSIGVASPGYKTHGMGTNTGTGGLLYYPWDALNYGTLMGAKVATMSFGSATNSGQGSINAAWSSGMNLHGSAGNEGRITVRYPGASDHVTGVMASNSSDYKSWFSNYNGPDHNPEYYDLVAPGSSIYSTYPGGSYAYMDGTSMSCPVAAGVVAMMRGFRPRKTNDEIDSLFYHSCDPMPDPLYSSGQLGWGRVNEYKALTAATGVEAPEEAVRVDPAAQEFALGAFAPNPTVSGGDVEFSLPKSAAVDLAVYNVSGQRIRTLTSGGCPAGRYTVRWDGKDSFGKPVAGGVYLYRLAAGGFSQSRSLVVLR